MQIDTMCAFANQRHWTVADTVEEVASSATDHRPKRQVHLKAAKQRQLNVRLVWKLDCSGRFLVDVMTTLRERTAVSVGCVSLTEALDPATPARARLHRLPSGDCDVRVGYHP